MKEKLPKIPYVQMSTLKKRLFITIGKLPSTSDLSISDYEARTTI